MTPPEAEEFVALGPVSVRMASVWGHERVSEFLKNLCRRANRADGYVCTEKRSTARHHATAQARGGPRVPIRPNPAAAQRPTVLDGRLGRSGARHQPNACLRPRPRVPHYPLRVALCPARGVGESSSHALPWSARRTRILRTRTTPRDQPEASDRSTQRRYRSRDHRHDPCRWSARMGGPRPPLRITGRIHPIRDDVDTHPCH